MTGEKSVEQACVTLLEAVFQGHKNAPFIVPFIAKTSEEKKVKYPVVMLGTDPFRADTPGSVLGYVPLRLGVRTQQNDDPDRSILEALFEIAVGEITEAKIGPLVMSPWLVLGIDNTIEGGVSVDSDNKTQDKMKPFRVPMFLSTTTTTTTTA